MWQILLAAAVAGSGLIVKRFRDSNSSNSWSKPSDEIFEQPNLCSIQNSSNQCEEESSIFRFSSASGSSPVKKSGSVSRQGGNVIVGDDKCGGGSKGLVVDFKTSTRRFVVCFNKKNKNKKKKRSTCRYASENCQPKGLFNYWWLIHNVASNSCSNVVFQKLLIN